VGWLLLSAGCAVALNVFVEPYVEYGLLTPTGSLPSPPFGQVLYTSPRRATGRRSARRSCSAA
jgi:hypothetical protein